MTEQSPIILIGMHRSGTTMIVKVLRSLGLFTGWQLQHNAEALFFVQRNEKLLNVCGGNWENPTPIDNLLSDSALRRAVAGELRRDLQSHRCVSFLGPLRYMRVGGVDGLLHPWGWKDPRNTFLLPIWLDLFPRAKVIHVHRHGVDVACSLTTREHKRKGQRLENSGLGIEAKRQMNEARAVSLLSYLSWKLRGLHRRLTPLNKYDRFTTRSSLRLEVAFDMWCTYVERAVHATQSIDNETLTVRYEDFLTDPVPHLHRLSEFCGLSAETHTIESVAGTIDCSRRFAFQRNEEARAFWEQIRSNGWMEKLGYSELP